MPNLVGVKFFNNPKTYTFDAGELACAVGSEVIVETEAGLSFGKVASILHPSLTNAVTDGAEPCPDCTGGCRAKPLAADIKPLLRLATDKDKEKYQKGLAARSDAMRVADAKILERKLGMRLTDCEFSFDGTKVTFYFTSDDRVDFRELVRDLAAHFHLRIELRQIGIRDECKMLGGIAPCGRPCCCAAFQKEYARTSVKMAKNQGLSLNPTKISGLCGRLMCCLEYENEHYVETGKRMPRIGSDIMTKDGVAIVLSNNMLKESVRVRIPVKDSYEIRDYALDEIGFEKAAIGLGSQKYVEKVQEEADDDLPDDLQDFFKSGAGEIRVQKVAERAPSSDSPHRSPPREEQKQPTRQSRPEQNRPRDERSRGGKQGDNNRDRSNNIPAGGNPSNHTRNQDNNPIGNRNRDNNSGGNRNREINPGDKRNNAGGRGLQGNQNSRWGNRPHDEHSREGNPTSRDERPVGEPSNSGQNSGGYRPNRGGYGAPPAEDSGRQNSRGGYRPSSDNRNNRADSPSNQNNNGEHPNVRNNNGDNPSNNRGWNRPRRDNRPPNGQSPQNRPNPGDKQKPSRLGTLLTPKDKG